MEIVQLSAITSRSEASMEVTEWEEVSGSRLLARAKGEPAIQRLTLSVRTIF